MGATVSRNDFTYSYSDEPHATRRKLILKKYPQMKKLMGVDTAFKWQVICLVAAQILSFFPLKNVSNFWLLFALAYFVGGVANHAIMLAIHEISHGMAFGASRPLANKVLAIIANLPIGVPMSISFKKYHLEHHRYQGDELLDTDVPTRMEASLFTNSLRKTIWCLLQPFFYTIRPLFVNPKPLDNMEVVNIIVQLAFDYVIAMTLGWHVVGYMIGGSLLAMGLHPVAGHFISEHTLMFDSDNKDCPRMNDARSPVDSCDMNDNITGRSLAAQEASKEIIKNVNGIAKHQNGSTDGHVMPSKGMAEQGDKVKVEVEGQTVDGEGNFLVPETCSYYGPLNYLTFNVGYHVEHHDFPSIPGSRLPMVSKIAPEFYTNLNHHTSWTNVLWRYITDPKIGPSARVRRPHNIKRNL